MITIIGNSPTIKKIVEDVFMEKAYVIGWREIKNIKNDIIEKKISNLNILVLAGYDYSTYTDEYNVYYEKNVLGPYQICQYLIDKKKVDDIIYVNTWYNDENKTYSRYFFAKKELENLLSNIDSAYNINVKTIVDEKGKILAKGGFITRLLFALLKVLGATEFEKTSSLQEKIKEYKKYRASKNQLEGVGLMVRRTQIIDRFLRLILG